MLVSKHYERMGYYVIEKLRTFLDAYFKRKLNNYLGVNMLFMF